MNIKQVSPKIKMLDIMLEVKLPLFFNSIIWKKISSYPPHIFINNQSHIKNILLED